MATVAIQTVSGKEGSQPSDKTQRMFFPVACVSPAFPLAISHTKGTVSPHGTRRWSDCACHSRLCGSARQSRPGMGFASLRCFSQTIVSERHATPGTVRCQAFPTSRHSPRDLRAQRRRFPRCACGTSTCVTARSRRRSASPGTLWHMTPRRRPQTSHVSADGPWRCRRHRWHEVGPPTQLTALKHPAHCADTVLSHRCPTVSRNARLDRLRCQ